MNQLYDISCSDYESQERWVLEGPDMSDIEFEQLWTSLIPPAAEKVQEVYGEVFDNVLLKQIVDLLVEHHSFTEIHALHNKHFDFASGEGTKKLFKYVPKELGKMEREFHKRKTGEEL